MPDKLQSTVSNYLHAYSDICEIRIRVDLPIVFTISSGNLVTGVNVTSSDVQYIIDRMTDGNYFKNEEIMRSGYITLKHGIRVGVAGDVFVSDGVVKVLRFVKYLNIRIPSVYICNCDEIINYIENNNFNSSILLFSPPCQGKTTVLRSIIYSLSASPYQKRIAVVDTNRELSLATADKTCICENLAGYPKSYGINLALKYLNPEYIACDEIGDANEAYEIASARHCGVPIIATAHAESFSSLFYRPNIENLLRNGAFDTVIKLSRNQKNISFQIKKVSEL